jgi:hypothetical protein
VKCVYVRSRNYILIYVKLTMKMKMKILEIISTLRESEKEEENHEIGTQMRAIFFPKKTLTKNGNSY